MAGIDISKLPQQILKIIADECDFNHNGIIENNAEISIFQDKAYTLKTNGDITIREYNNIFGNRLYDAKDIPSNKIIEQCDATYVAPKVNPALETPLINTKIQMSNLRRYDDYKKHPKYPEVLQIVKKHMNKKNKIANKAEFDERAEYATQIVIEKCQKYNIESLMPLVADLLGSESGGYQFEADAVINGHWITNKEGEQTRSQFKGVMQINLQVCKIIYGEGNCAYDHEHHCKQDLERINKLRQKYPTAQELFDAQRMNPELGVEVGILALKFKIHAKNNNVNKGIEYYGGNQYKYDRTTLPPIPTEIDIEATN